MYGKCNATRIGYSVLKTQRRTKNKINSVSCALFMCKTARQQILHATHGTVGIGGD